MDPKKIEAIVKWPRFITLKSLKGFLGLRGYYRKFIKDYGAIATPLTTLLKKYVFGWNEKVKEAFERFIGVCDTSYGVELTRLFKNLHN